MYVHYTESCVAQRKYTNLGGNFHFWEVRLCIRMVLCFQVTRYFLLLRAAK